MAGQQGGGVDRGAAWTEFLRMMRWIALAGVLMVIGSLVYIGHSEELTTAVVLTTVGGVFLSVLLGCGLFAAAFFSSKSGHDDAVTGATNGHPAHSERSRRDATSQCNSAARGPEADEIAACAARGFCSRC